MKLSALRRILAMIVCLVMLVSLVGCDFYLPPEQTRRTSKSRDRKDSDEDQTQATQIDQDSQPTTDWEETESFESIVPPEVVVDWDNLVTDAFTEKLDNEYSDCYHIPQINHGSSDVVALNKKIYDRFYDLIQENVYDCMSDYGYAATRSVQYTWGRNDVYLSIVIETLDGMTSYNEMFIYTVNLDTGKVIPEMEVLAAYGLSADEYYDMAKATMASYWEERRDDMIEFCGEELFEELVTKTLSNQNVRATIPYINSDGDLCFVGRVYSPAAADYYPHLFNVTRNEHIGFVSCTMPEHQR